MKPGICWALPRQLARMEGEGIGVAGWVKEMVQSGNHSFYTYDGATRLVYSPLDKAYVPGATKRSGGQD